MKKYTTYILIMIIVVGLFISVKSLHAETDPCASSGTVGSPAYQICQLNPPATNSGGTTAPAINATPTTAVPGQYHLLAPLPCPTGVPGVQCTNTGTGSTFQNFNYATTNAQNQPLTAYLNLMIKLFIGICAVLAVVMIIMGGLEYMTSELISSKEAGKERITNAIFGLLLALGAWALLYTINPNLLDTNAVENIPGATVNVTISNFQISSSGPQSRYGTSVTIDFNTQAYPAAVTAQVATGVDPALVLAIFNQETSSGANTGACFPANANMTAADQTALASIVGPTNVATTHVSCSLSSGHGGAIGLTQFMPTTWNSIVNSPAGQSTFAGRSPDPWNVSDALTMTALYLKQLGGAGTNPVTQQQAACSYFGACSSSGVNYGAQVMTQVTSIQQQIAQAKKDGKIS